MNHPSVIFGFEIDANIHFNIMLKTTSLASVIGVEELFLTTRTTSAAAFKVFEMFLVLALNDLLLTTVWAVVQVAVEARLQRHETSGAQLSWWQRIVSYLSGESEDTASRGMA